MKRRNPVLKRVWKLTLLILLAFSMIALATTFSIQMPTYASAENDAMTNMLDPAQEEAINKIIAPETEAASADPSANNNEPTSETSSSSEIASQVSAEESTSSNTDATVSNNEETDSSVASKNQNAPSTKDSDITATVVYYEYTNYDDPDAIMVEPGLRFLGKHTINDVKVGQQLNAWDYVVRIPGHFFYDGWPNKLTISEDSSKNVIELFYMKLWQYEYTVNYYVMTGADLSADSWTGALKPDDVKFTKIGSETFENQRFDTLVKGDAYEYKLDDMYVIDTYPAQIRVGADADNNVINVLYTPNSTTLPDDLEIPDSVADDFESGDSNGTLPDDETLNKDDLIALLPDDIEADTALAGSSTEGSDEFEGVAEDFLGSDLDLGELQVTNAMLEDPITQQEADQVLEVYKTGQHSGNLAQTGDTSLPIIVTLVTVIILAVAILVIAFTKRSGRKGEMAR